jgi:hypothetical protein
VAQRLRDDEVRLELAHDLVIELVDRLPALGSLAHRSVDLGRRQALLEHVARDRLALARLLGEVALVGHPDDLLAEAQREEQLGSVWDEADDPHEESVWHD